MRPGDTDRWCNDGWFVVQELIRLTLKGFPMSKFGYWGLASVVLMTAFGVIHAGGPLYGQDKGQDDDQVKEARSAEARQLIDLIKTKGYYELNGTAEKAAVARLREMGDESAPAIAEWMAASWQNRRQGNWLLVFRPLHVLDGMGVHGKVALPDIVKALDHEHPAVVAKAAVVLDKMGPAANDAVPALQKVWEQPDLTENSKKRIADAIKSISPQAAEKLGIK